MFRNSRFGAVVPGHLNSHADNVMKEFNTEGWRFAEISRHQMRSWRRATVTIAGDPDVAVQAASASRDTGAAYLTLVDRTGLQGAFNVDLDWSADASVGATTSNTPSIFTALQEQLGLPPEPSRGPVEGLVIESVERPTPD